MPNGDENGNSLDADDFSHLTLDRLLASLELEKDIMDEHLSKMNNNNPQYRPKAAQLTNGHSAYANGAENGFHENLNDVIENLADFSRSEEHRQRRINEHFAADATHSNGVQQFNSSNHHTNHSHNKNHQYIVNSTYNNHLNHRVSNDVCHSTIKRIASESENSSSVSPSLSERSNGFVMWNDQVNSRTLDPFILFS